MLFFFQKKFQCPFPALHNTVVSVTDHYGEQIIHNNDIKHHNQYMLFTNPLCYIFHRLNAGAIEVVVKLPGFNE